MQAKKFIFFFIDFRYKTGNYFLVCSRTFWTFPSYFNNNVIILITMIILVNMILNFHTVSSHLVQSRRSQHLGPKASAQCRFTLSRTQSYLSNVLLMPCILKVINCTWHCELRCINWNCGMSESNILSIIHNGARLKLSTEKAAVCLTETLHTS